MKGKNIYNKNIFTRNDDFLELFCAKFILVIAWGRVQLNLIITRAIYR